MIAALLALSLLAQSFFCQNNTCHPATIVPKRTAVADVAYTAVPSDGLVAFTSISATRIVTLPSPASLRVRQSIKVADESGSVSGSVKITLTPASGTINGSASLDITQPFGAVTVYSDGTNYLLPEASVERGPAVISSAATTDTGGVVSVSAATLTSGVALKVAGGGANTLTGGIDADVEMGAATVGTGVKVVTSGVYTDTAAAPLWVSAPSASTATFGIERIDAAGLTTGSALVVNSGVPGTMTTGSILRLSDGTSDVFKVGVDGHQTFVQTTAPVVTNTGGSGPSCVGCTDTNGKIVATTAANTNVITLTFHTSATPRGCVITPADANTAVDLKATGGGVVAVAAGSFTVSAPSANWAANQKNIYYSCFF